MVFELVKQYIGQNFLLITVAVGFWLILSRNSAEVIGKSSLRLIRAVILIAVVLSVTEFVHDYFASLPYPTIGRKICSWTGYTLRPLIVVFLFRILVYRDIRTRLLYLPIVLNAVLYASTFFPQTEKYVFTFGETNNFMRGPFSYTSPILCGAYLFLLVVIVIKKFETEGESKELRGVLWCAFATTMAALYEMFFGGTNVLTSAILISTLFYYFMFFSQSSYEKTAEKDTLLSDQRAAMVVQEIQPRFIYDVLSRIRGQADENGEVAKGTLDNLIHYLENNMNSIDFVHPIPFIEELERTQTYIKIIRASFPGLTVDYQLEDMDFLIPALTLQHMVENCVNHAFEGRDEGTIVIKAFGSESGHTVIIQDNGRGFSSREQLDSENQGSRFGIANVTDRLQRMCNGDLNIVSRQDSGTTVMISIPNEDVPMPKREKKKRRLEIPNRKKPEV